MCVTRVMLRFTCFSSDPLLTAAAPVVTYILVGISVGRRRRRGECGGAFGEVEAPAVVVAVDADLGPQGWIRAKSTEKSMPYRSTGEPLVYIVCATKVFRSVPDHLVGEGFPCGRDGHHAGFAGRS